MTKMHFILGLSAIYLLESTVFVSGNGRLPREVDDPPPIDCQLSSWGTWSECDPCTNHQYRSRSIIKFGQYKGARCVSSLGDRKRCVANDSCNEEPIQCGNDFECESGRCIKTKLLCNGDNDCGDYSDENCEDDREPKPPCRNMEVELSEIGRTAGNGLNILGMETMRNPFDNEYFHGLCERVRDGNTRTYYRKPWNVASLNYESKADKAFTSETFEDSESVMTKIIQESTDEFKLSLSVKYTPSEINDTSVKVDGGIGFSKNSSLEKIKRYSNEKSKTFLKVSGKVQLAKFNMRTRGYMLSSSFIEDIKELPTAYEKAEYFSFLEMYGTHHTISGDVGGKYELVYVLDKTVLKTKDITTLDVYDCLNYNLGLNVDAKDINVNPKIDGKKCTRGGFIREGGISQSPEITLDKPIMEVILSLADSSVSAPALLDSGAAGYFIDAEFAAKNYVPLQPRSSPLAVEAIDGNTTKLGIIDNVISFVEGGTVKFTAALEEKLKRQEAIDLEDFLNWAESLIDAPVVIRKKPSPIYTLIPTDMKDAYVKSRNLERAIEDYLDEHSTCKCQPCQNGGTVMVIDGECICKCPDRFEGLACQKAKSELFENNSDEAAAGIFSYIRRLDKKLGEELYSEGSVAQVVALTEKNQLNPHLEDGAVGLSPHLALKENKHYDVNVTTLLHNLVANHAKEIPWKQPAERVGDREHQKPIPRLARQLGGAESVEGQQPTDSQKPNPPALAEWLTNVQTKPGTPLLRW
ncbi:complement component C9 [Rhinophrynus dorsalis]